MYNQTPQSNDLPNLARTLFYFSHTNDLWKELSSMQYALIKGEALSCLAYQAKGKRQYGDIDILVDKTNLIHVEDICKKLGYSTQNQTRSERVFYLSSSHQIYPYYKQVGKIKIDIDLNFDIFWGEYTGKRISINEFLFDTIEMQICNCKIKTLPPLKAMIQLILHHYKEMNSIYHLAGHNCINYNMFKDVYYLWKNNQDTITLDKLNSMCSEYEIIPYAYYILYFTNQIFDDPELEKYVAALKTSDGVALLDYYGLAEKERKLWKVDFKTRLETGDLYGLIKGDLTEVDIEKLERNKRIFG